jgi:hypothetical protein
VGRPWELEHAAKVWREDIGGEISEIAGWFNLSQTLVDDYWSGPAMESYKAILGPQEMAIVAIKDRAQKTADALEVVVASVRAFWLYVMLRIVKLAAEILEIGLGWRPDETLATIGSMIRSLVGFITDITGEVNKAYSEYNKAVTAISNASESNEAFPRKRESGEASWPAPTEPLSTASSDWNIGWGTE